MSDLAQLLIFCLDMHRQAVLNRRSNKSFHLHRFSAQSSLFYQVSEWDKTMISPGHRIFLILGNSHQIRSPQQFADLLPDATLHYPTDPSAYPIRRETWARERTERVDLQCWHLKQERWKTTPSVESWSIGYTVLVHTLHFCCVPLNIISRSPANLPSLCPSLTGRGRRDLTESPIRPWPARAWRGMKNGHLARRPDCRAYIRRSTRSD